MINFLCTMLLVILLAIGIHLDLWRTVDGLYAVMMFCCCTMLTDAIRCRNVTININNKEE